MIDPKLLISIQKTAQVFWDTEVTKPAFKARARGKEIGHRMADFIDDETTALLVKKNKALYQKTAKGIVVTRSMGDVWLPSGGIFNPINVKTSITGAKGQPNMVSLKKLLKALLEHRINSYYLLIVKVSIEKKITCKVHLVDLLDYLDFMAYDAGPGQIMLKASKFFAAREAGVIPVKRSLGEKVKKLTDMLESGDARLAKNRKKVLKRFRAMVSGYIESSHIVTIATQMPYNLR